VGDFAQGKLNDAKALRNQAADQQDPERAAALNAQAQALEDTWGEGKTGRVLLHTLVGGLSGGLSGAVGAATSQSLVPLLGEQIAQMDIPPEMKSALIAVAGAAIGGATGGTAGAISGLTATTNNNLNHPDASRLLALQKKLNAGQLTQEEALERAALITKDEQTNAQLRACTYSTTPACQGVKADYATTQQSYLPSQQDIQSWADRKAQTGPYTAAQLVDAYNANFTKGLLPPTQTSSGDLNPAADWIRDQLSQDATVNGANVLDKIYMGWATANAPSVGGSIASALIANQALTKAGAKVGADLGAIASNIELKVQLDIATAKAKIENNIYTEGSSPPAWTTGKPGTPELNLATHWEKHKLEFPGISSANAYYREATSFVTNPPNGTLIKVSGTDILLYNPSTNTFAVRTVDGFPRTMFKPSPAEHGYPTNIDFWNAK
jgi:hypothetical protein